jgi:hypothetical protein
MARHLFISYSRADQAYVERLAAHLEAHGLTVWWDYHVDPGESFGPRIKKAIDECAAVVPVLTPDSATSRWVEREITYADEKRKAMFPLLLRGCDPPINLVGVQFESVIDGRMPSARFIDRLHEAVGRTPIEPLAPVPEQFAKPESAEVEAAESAAPTPKLGQSAVTIAPAPAAAPVSAMATVPAAGARRVNHLRRGRKPVFWWVTGVVVIALVLAMTVRTFVVNHVTPGPSDTNNSRLEAISTPATSTPTTSTPPEVIPTTDSVPTATPGATTQRPRAEFPDAAMATFARGWTSECSPFSGGLTYAGARGFITPLNRVGCWGAPPASAPEIGATGIFIGFTKFKTSADASNDISCDTRGEETIYAPGLQGNLVSLASTSGGRVGDYCEDAYTGGGSASAPTDIIICISWTDPTRPFLGSLQFDLPASAGGKNFNPSIWPQMRGYWAAHAES